MENDREEEGEIKKYIEKHMIAHLFNKLLQRVILEMPEKPIDFLMDSLKRGGSLCLFSFTDLPKVCTFSLDYTYATDEQLIEFSRREGIKFIENFKIAPEHVERLRRLKIYYDHLFVREGETVKSFPLAIPLTAGKAVMALQVISTELLQLRANPRW